MTDAAAPAAGEQGEEQRNDRNLRELDDEQDREELRTRYYGLLQELRVILPGVQVLLAFLLSVPFANRFPELDDTGRTLFGIAVVGTWCAVICLLTPTVFHRVSDRRARKARLRWAIRTTLGGLVLLAASLLAALLCVLRLVFGTPVAVLLVAPVTLAMIGLWVVAPLRIRLESHR